MRFDPSIVSLDLAGLLIVRLSAQSINYYVYFAVVCMAQRR